MRVLSDASPASAEESVAAVVLAAGRSTRMQGRHKLLLDWEGRSVIATTVERLLGAGIPRIVVVTGYRHPAVATEIGGFPVEIRENREHATGLSSSIRCGVAAAAGARWFLFCLGDMPYVREATVRTLAAAAIGSARDGFIVPTWEGRRGNPVAISAGYAPALHRLTGDEGARVLLRRFPHDVLEVPVDDPGIQIDIDTPADWELRSAERDTG